MKKKIKINLLSYLTELISAIKNKNEVRTLACIDLLLQEIKKL